MRYDPEIISKKIDRRKRILLFFKVIFYLIIILIVLFSIFLSMLELGNSKEVPSFFNIKIYQVESGSMYPKLKQGDIIFVKCGYNIDSYKKGNIISYNYNNEVITHRITDFRIEGENKYIITKGDNNELKDDYYVEYDSIIGKVIYTLPRPLTVFVKLLQDKRFLYIFLMLVIFLIVYIGKLNEKKILRKIDRQNIDKVDDRINKFDKK